MISGRWVVVALLICGVALAQTPPKTHGAMLTWQDDDNPTGTTYTVYRSTGLCSGSPVFTKIATTVPEKYFDDATVTPGNYCYQVTATAGGVESAPSNTALAPIPLFAPVQLTIQVR